MSEPLSDEQLAEWARKYLVPAGATETPLHRLIQEVRRLRDELHYIPPQKNHFGEIVRGHACARSFELSVELKKAEAERDRYQTMLGVIAGASPHLSTVEQIQAAVREVLDQPVREEGEKE